MLYGTGRTIFSLDTYHAGAVRAVNNNVLLHLDYIVHLVVQYFHHEVPSGFAFEAAAEVLEYGRGLTACEYDIIALTKECIVSCFDIPHYKLR